MTPPEMLDDAIDDVVDFLDSDELPLGSPLRTAIRALARARVVWIREQIAGTVICTTENTIEPKVDGAN